MSSYKHTYSDYVHHILNKSPSKTCYTFAKAQRFPQIKKQELLFPSHQLLDNQVYGEQKKNIYYQRPSTAVDPYTDYSQSKYYCDPQRNNTKYNSRISPPKFISNSYQNQITFSPNKKMITQTQTLSPNNIKYKNESQSPKKDKKGANNSHSSSQIRQKGKQQKQSPSKNISITGYYPVGIEISSKGKYINSKIKNIVSTSFGKSPPKNQRLLIPPDHRLPPGMYETFSEFGPHKPKYF